MKVRAIKTASGRFNFRPGDVFNLEKKDAQELEADEAIQILESKPHRPAARASETAPKE